MQKHFSQQTQRRRRRLVHAGAAVETDEEQAGRERGEEATRQRIEAAERVQLQRLRAKYGDAT